MESNMSDHAELLLERPLVEDRIKILVTAGQTLHEALSGLNLKRTQPVIALVNGTVCDLSYRLNPGDSVRFLVQISGGSRT